MDDRRKQIVDNICNEFQQTFHIKGDARVFTNIGEQEIHLKPNIKPSYIKQYRVCPTHRKFINEQTKELLKQGLAEPSLSPWNSPVLAVPKDRGKDLRLVIDYRKVNNLIEDDKFPLPHMIDVLDDLHGVQYFSVIDLHQGYYQIFLKQESRPITAWTCDLGHMQLVAMPQGLKTSPACFMRIMTLALGDLIVVETLN